MDSGKMIFLGGSKRSYHCECGCNVFRDGPGFKGYETLLCNACGAAYETERRLPDLEYQI